jgi:hypothetical protein
MELSFCRCRLQICDLTIDRNEKVIFAKIFARTLIILRTLWIYVKISELAQFVWPLSVIGFLFCLLVVGDSFCCWLSDDCRVLSRCSKEIIGCRCRWVLLVPGSAGCRVSHVGCPVLAVDCPCRLSLTFSTVGAQLWMPRSILSFLFCFWVWAVRCNMTPEKVVLQQISMLNRGDSNEKW